MDLQSPEILEFPSSATATYLNEGAANVVYTINVPHPATGIATPPPDDDDAKAELTSKFIDPWHGKSRFLSSAQSRFLSPVQSRDVSQYASPSPSSQAPDPRLSPA